ncbi:ATP-binding protein [Streptomyces sp. NPDC059578]|uniref:ATP-binding protein n=1 Tax=Streptomyces sp. NPDC059578 TaxID=3346874 RepID=UPI0036B1B0A8
MRPTSRPGPRTNDSSDVAEVPRDLPLELTAFVGRAPELTRLGEATAHDRLVTVVGPGGVGKSRLVARAAAACALPDGARLVDLTAVHAVERVDRAAAESLGLADHAVRPALEVLREHFAGQRALLVLDGFEHLVAPCAALVGDLLRAAPGLRVLAAGRRPLGVRGERVVPLAPLDERDAVALFADRAEAAVPGFALDEDNTADVREICRRLDGIPLAVELAAGRLTVLSPGQLLHRLDDRFRLLTGGGRDAPPRHRTLRTAIGWSHELCTAQERLLWARLSVFAGSFDLEAVEYVCGAQGLSVDEVLDVLGELLAQSVVSREDGPGGVRYRMLETVRAYGADWLEGSGDTARLRHRHRDWYAGLATWCELEWFSSRQAEAAARIEVELPNLRAALEHALTEPGDTHPGLHLASTLWFCWVGCGRLAEGRYWLQRSIELDQGPEAESDGVPDARLKALYVFGHVALLQGDTVAALTALHECRDEAERTDDAVAVAYAEHRTGFLALVGDDAVRAERLLRSALERYQGIGELNSLVLLARVELAAAVLVQCGFPGGAVAARGRGDRTGSCRTAEAVRLCEEVREVCEDHGERWALAYALLVLAYVAWSEGDPARARRLLEECLVIEHGFQDLVGALLAIELLALVTLDQGDPVEAAGALWPSVGSPLFGSVSSRDPRVTGERRCRARLGPAGYEAAVREGARLGLDAAVRRALGRSAEPAPVAPQEPREEHGPGGAAEPDAAEAETARPAASPAPRSGETTG